MTAERTPHADDSLLCAPLLAITRFGLRAPATVLVAACGLAVLAIAFTVNGLTFKTSRLDLLNPRSEYNQRWLSYLAEFGNRDDACLVVRAERTDDLKAAIDDLATRLRAEPALFDSVLYRRDLARLKSKALFYLPADQLALIERQLAAAAAMLPRPGEPADLSAELARLNDELTHVGAPTPERRARLDEQYAHIAGRLLTAISGAPMPPTGVDQPSFDARALSQFDPQYLLADEGKLGFVLTRLNPQPADASPASTAIARLRRIVAETQAHHPQAWIGLTGMPVIEHDEMAASQFDMLWTSLVSLGLVLMLYFCVYGGLRHAALVNALLLLGAAYSFAFVTLAIGHLNILSAAFSAVLIGLGIDFAIHYVACYLNLRRQGLDEQDALLQMVVEVGPGVVTGGVTTAAAFFMAAMTDFVGIRELGLVAGGGILLCVLTTVVVLPPLVLLVDRRWPLVTLPTILPASRWFQFPLRWPRLTMGLALVVVGLIGLGGFRLRYDHNLLNLQPRHLESADIERQLFTRLDDSVWFGVSICRTPEELLARRAAFEKLPTVAKTEEIASLVPAVPADRAARVQALCRRMAQLASVRTPAIPIDDDSIDIQRLLPEIARAQELLARESPFETAASTALAQVRAALAGLPRDQLTARVVQSRSALSQLAAQLKPLAQLTDPAPPALADLPRELTDRFVGRNRTFLLKVFARGNVWNMDQLERFVRELESVDPRITGHPVQTYYASRHMQASYLWAGLYALGAVLVLLWIDFQSLRHSLLATVPLAVGFTAMCGCLGWLDIPFNPANMIVLPLILGIGVDHGVHLVHLYRQQPGRFKLGDATTVAVILTASTTTASFGALILARHQGLQSLGQALTLGVTTCLASSIVFFPALLAWLTRNRPLETAAAPPGSAAKVDMPKSNRDENSADSAESNSSNSITSEAEVHREALEDRVGESNSSNSITSGAVVARAAVEPPPPPSANNVASIQPPPVEPGDVPWPDVLPLPPPAATEEDVAALLEAALSARGVAPPHLGSPEDHPNVEPLAPRRRNLPRRSEVA